VVVVVLVVVVVVFAGGPSTIGRTGGGPAGTEMANATAKAATPTRTARIEDKTVGRMTGASVITGAVRQDETQMRVLSSSASGP